MAKRSTGKFKRKKHDKYFTPPKPMVPLYPHLEEKTTFCEPAAGNGRMVGHLEGMGHECLAAFDIKKQITLASCWGDTQLEKSASGIASLFCGVSIILGITQFTLTP